MDVLVIEDDDNVTLLYRLALEGAGHSVQTVTQGRDGLDRAARQPFDVIVLDGMLPDVDGLEVLSRLREGPTTAAVPVVMASARVGRADQEAALAAGATAYLVKPFMAAELVSVVAAATGDQVGRSLVAPAPGAGSHPAPAITVPSTGTPGEDRALAQVLSLAFDAIVSIDDDQRIVGFNKGAEDTFGYLAEEVLGKPLSVLMPERFADAHQAHVRGFAEGGEAGRLMGGQRFVYARRRDGSEFPAEASITKLDLGDRSVLTAILRDATERQRTEAELRARAEQQAAVAELGLRAITVADLDELLDDAAHTLERVLRVDLVKIALADTETDAAVDELRIVAGVGWTPGVVGSRRSAAPGTIVGLSLGRGEPVVFEDVGTDPRFAPDPLLVDQGVTSGVHVPVRGSVRPVGVVGAYVREPRRFTEDDLHVVQAIANVVASRVLRDAHERRLRAFLDAAPDATLVVDVTGRIVSANAQAEALFGYPREELQRLSVDALVPDEVRMRHGAYRRAFEAERRARPMGEGIELQARRRDGSTVPVDIMLRPLETDEGSFVVAAVRDITDRRRNEMAREAFLHAVSHELRTPLTAVLGFASLLTDHYGEALGPEALMLAERIWGSAQRLDHLLGDLLDLDRLSRGVVEAQRRNVAVADLVGHTVQAINLDGRELTVTIDPPDLVVAVDAAQVERIVENLVVNAVRHTPSGARIELHVGRSANGVLLRVDDDGPGVPAEARETIFEPFRRNATAFTPGTGIGLSLVARFAELHGGRAWVEDRPQGGSSFRVVLAL